MTARQAHEALVRALDAYRRAEKNAVLRFAEIDRRKHYRALGYGSMELYAVEALGFSRSKYFDFAKLARALDELPAVKEAVTTGEIGWTKAREVVKVATPRTEKHWVAEARTSSRRELKAKVTRTKKAARVVEPVPALLHETPAPEPVEVPSTVTVSMTSLQRAKYEALIEKARKQGVGGSAAEVLLAALEDLVAGEKSSRLDSASPYQVVVSKCDECGKAEIRANGKLDRVSNSQKAAIECDARVLEPGGRNTATIKPSVRRQILIRDGHRCQAPGCRHTHFLEVHHIKPREMGGSNKPENLVTLCSACHRMVHEHPKTRIALPRAPKATTIAPDINDHL